MTQELINKYFKSELGQQLEEIWVTEDDQPFIRYKEAVDYSKENGFDVGEITLWHKEHDNT